MLLGYIPIPFFWKITKKKPWNRRRLNYTTPTNCTAWWLHQLQQFPVLLNDINPWRMSPKSECKKILVIWRFYWNPITLVLIWKVLRQAFRWYHYFWHPSTLGWVISLFEIFSNANLAHFFTNWRYPNQEHPTFHKLTIKCHHESGKCICFCHLHLRKDENVRSKKSLKFVKTAKYAWF
jgi:hypothetical protein